MNNPINSLTTHVEINVCQDSHDAVRKGYLYRQPVFEGLQVDKVVVVKKGTEQGKNTVDFIVQDAKGQKYVFLITQNLLKLIAEVGQ